MADAADLKSAEQALVWVRLPPPPPMEGKVPVSYIGDLVERFYGKRRQEVLIDASNLTDSAVVDLDAPIVVSTDPITGADNHVVTQLAVHINANDVRVAGGEPVAFLAVLLLPTNFPQKDIEGMFEHLHEGLDYENAQLVGGHSEFTSAVTKPVVVGTMFGKRIRVLGKDLVRPGQHVFFAGTLGREAMMILKGSYGDDILKVSVKPIMDVALNVPSLVFAHDLTEGGLVAGLWELTRGTSLGIEASFPESYLDQELTQLSRRFQFNPYKIISSGSVLLVCENEREMREKLEEEHLPFVYLGQLHKNSVTSLNGVPLGDLDPEGPDELWTLQKRV